MVNENYYTKKLAFV